MKLITLNTWGGTIYDPIVRFIAENADTDIFCLQEVFHTESDQTVIEREARADLFKALTALLPDHVGYFASCQDGLQPGGVPADFHLQFGLATFVKKSITVRSYYDMFVFRDKDACVGNDLRTMGRNIQCLELLDSGVAWSIINFHGLWNGQGKSDTDDRISQSKKVRENYERLEGKRILCGDFNLLPETESLRILGDGMRDLIAEYGVSSTRSSLYTKPLKLADYIFTSPEVEVERFEVLQDEVSDHLPLLLVAR